METKLCVTLMEPGSPCLCCSYRMDVIAPLSHNTKTILPATKLLADSPDSPRLRPTQLVVPPASLLCARVLWLPPGSSVLSGPEVGKSSLLGCVEAPGGRFGHCSIHSFVPVSQRRFQTAPVRAGECSSHQRRGLIG